MATQLPRLPTTADVSEYLDVSERTVEGRRSGDEPPGPPFVRIGARVRYPEHLLLDWVSDLTRGRARS